MKDRTKAATTATAPTATTAPTTAPTTARTTAHTTAPTTARTTANMTVRVKARKIAELAPSHVEYEFGDFNGKGNLVVAGEDPTFAYWNCSGADSPWVPVAFELKPDGWRLCPAIMRGLSYPEKELERVVKFQNENNHENERTFCLGSTIWNVMLLDIYSGNAPEAWKLLRRVWPKGKLAEGMTASTETRRRFMLTGQQDTMDMTQDQFISELKARMKQSPFWRDLVLLNKGSL